MTAPSTRTTTSSPNRPTPARRLVKKSLRSRLWDARFSYVLLAPGLILIGMFSLYPMVASWYYSFFRWSGLRDSKLFLGFDNFRELIGDPFFWQAYGRSL